MQIKSDQVHSYLTRKLLQDLVIDCENDVAVIGAGLVAGSDDGSIIMTSPSTFSLGNIASATAISGGDYSTYVKENAFDKSLTTYWASSQVYTGISGNAYIGQNFGTTKHIRTVRFYTYSAIANNISSVRVQRWDGSTWVDVLTAAVATTASTWIQIDLPASAAATQWRMLANANLGSGQHWYVAEVKMSEQVNLGLDTGTPTSNTWYYIWMVWNPTTESSSFIWSLSNTSPTMPSGYTKKRLIGAVGFGNGFFGSFHQIDNEVTLTNSGVTLDSGDLVNGNFNNALCTSAIPLPICRKVLLTATAERRTSGSTDSMSFKVAYGYNSGTGIGGQNFVIIPTPAAYEDERGVHTKPWVVDPTGYVSFYGNGASASCKLGFGLGIIAYTLNL